MAASTISEWIWPVLYSASIQVHLPFLPTVFCDCCNTIRASRRRKISACWTPCVTTYAVGPRQLICCYTWLRYSAAVKCICGHLHSCKCQKHMLSFHTSAELQHHQTCCCVYWSVAVLLKCCCFYCRHADYIYMYRCTYGVNSCKLCSIYTTLLHSVTR